MQVKPLLPARSVRIFPFESIATMVAFAPRLAGAADIALAIAAGSAALVPEPVAMGSASAPVAAPRRAATKIHLLVRAVILSLPPLNC
jgi:hypothetical protein